MIQFDEKSHTYTLDGVELPSVTHICRFLAYDYKSDKPWLAETGGNAGDRRVSESLPPLPERLPPGLGADRAPHGESGIGLRRNAGPIRDAL